MVQPLGHRAFRPEDEVKERGRPQDYTVDDTTVTVFQLAGGCWNIVQHNDDEPDDIIHLCGDINDFARWLLTE